MDILEQEIFRLRVDKEQLNQVAEDWRKCCLILTKVEPLLALQHTAPAFMRQLGPQVSFGPGIESWHNATDSHLQVSRGLPLRTVASEYQQSMQPTIHSFQNHFHRLGVNEPLGPVLFQNCESTKHVIPPQQ